MWGLNSHRQVGLDSPAYVDHPVKIMDKVMDVACGDFHTVAIIGMSAR